MEGGILTPSSRKTEILELFKPADLVPSGKGFPCVRADIDVKGAALLIHRFNSAGGRMSENGHGHDI